MKKRGNITLYIILYILVNNADTPMPSPLVATAKQQNW